MPGAETEPEQSACGGRAGLGDPCRRVTPELTDAVTRVGAQAPARGVVTPSRRLPGSPPLVLHSGRNASGRRPRPATRARTQSSHQSPCHCRSGPFTTTQLAGAGTTTCKERAPYRHHATVRLRHTQGPALRQRKRVGNGASPSCIHQAQPPSMPDPRLWPARPTNRAPTTSGCHPCEHRTAQLPPPTPHRPPPDSDCIFISAGSSSPPPPPARAPPPTRRGACAAETARTRPRRGWRRRPRPRPSQ